MGKLRRARRRRQIQADRRAIRRQRVHDAGPCRRCIDCADDEHHWGDSYVGTADTQPEHPAALRADAWYECKHCPAWCLDLPDPPCWCGEPHPHYDTDHVDQTCGGSGMLRCLCGGDLCVCHNHDEIECPGCDECDFGEADDEDYEDDDYDNWEDWS